MKTDKTILVTKFGGAAIKDLDNFSRVAELVFDSRKEYDIVLVVISAMWQMTDQLHALAQKISSNPPKREHDMLLTVGERISMSLLAMMIEGMGEHAISFTGSQAGIITNDEHSDAKILDVRTHRLLPHLDGSKFVIVAGFQGVSQRGEITTLGRGGSDTTAVALATALRAERVRFYKDVAGMFECDPKLIPAAKHLPYVTYDEAEVILKKSHRPLLHPRALHLAKKNCLPLEIVSFEGGEQKSMIVTKGENRPGQPIFEVKEELANS